MKRVKENNAADWVRQKKQTVKGQKAQKELETPQESTSNLKPETSRQELYLFH